MNIIMRIKNKFDFEVVIVDGGSTDKTMSIIEEYQRHIPIKVVHDQGKGLGYARDIGWRLSSADYIVMLDSDVLVNERFLEAAIKILGEDEKLGAMAAKLKPISLDGGWLGKFQEKNLAIYLHHKDPQYPAEAVALHTACTVFKRRVLQEVNGFDEYFDLAKEDSDISYRIRKAGYKLAYLNYCAAHLERARILKVNFRYGRSYALISRKHPDIEKLWRLKNIVLTMSIFFPILQPLVYMYYLTRYMRIEGLNLSERMILPLIELIRQDARAIGMLYQLIIGKLFSAKV